MAFASRSNRSWAPVLSDRWDGRIFTATVRSSRVSRARYTSPIAPAPSGATISYGPRRVPGNRVMRAGESYPRDGPRGTGRGSGRMPSSWYCWMKGGHDHVADVQPLQERRALHFHGLLINDGAPGLTPVTPPEASHRPVRAWRAARAC